MTLFAVTAPSGPYQAALTRWCGEPAPATLAFLRGEKPRSMAARKLKVFQAQFGFYDTVVAAASQAAALRAWGTYQNLFASGEAKVTADEAAIAAALQAEIHRTEVSR